MTVKLEYSNLRKNMETMVECQSSPVRLQRGTHGSSPNFLSSPVNDFGAWLALKTLISTKEQCLKQGTEGCSQNLGLAKRLKFLVSYLLWWMTLLGKLFIHKVLTVLSWGIMLAACGPTWVSLAWTLLLRSCAWCFSTDSLKRLWKWLAPGR